MQSSIKRPRHCSTLLWSGGFTLIELMIVAAIVAILTAVAYPSYIEQVRKSRRSDAQAALIELAQWMERFYTENSRYDQTRATTPVPVALPFTQSPKSGGGPAGGYYTLSVATPERNQFTLSATPTSAQDQDKCKTLTLTHTGEKGVAGGATLSVQDCWRS